MTLRPPLVVLALLAAVGLPVAGYLRPATAVPGEEQRSYTALEPACTIKDDRLTSVSGMAVRADGTWVINDRGAVLYRLRPDCSVAAVRDLGPELTKLGITLTDVEDLAVGPDGWLWLSDTGGNRKARSTVTLVGWKDAETPVRTVELRYSSGTHDTETLMFDTVGRAVVVTKVPGSAPAEVFASRLPLGSGGDGTQSLTLVGTTSLPRVDGAGPGSRLITAGDVDRTGTYVVLRTYTDGWEFDAPDGDVAEALVSGQPRRVPLPKTKQGEAIAYSEDGSELLTTGEGSPVDLDRVQIVSGR
jgi:hypothetical protein